MAVLHSGAMTVLHSGAKTLLHNCAKTVLHSWAKTILYSGAKTVLHNCAMTVLFTPRSIRHRLHKHQWSRRAVHSCRGVYVSVIPARMALLCCVIRVWSP